MIDTIDILWLPFLACVILTGIHVYLGTHVIRRGVIFVDLALAQLAVLGSLVTHSLMGILFFNFLGAALFSFVPIQKKNLSAEAYIGIIYVLCSALSVLIISKSPHEGELIKDMLVGNILLVSPATLLKTTLLYSVVGIIFYKFHQKFNKLTEQESKNQKSSPLGNFLFYFLFGIVVASSVKLAGVLLVFSFLIIPAACTQLLKTPSSQILGWGWLIGILASLGGMLLSVFLDLPTGASVVTAFGFIFGGTLLWSFVKN